MSWILVPGLKEFFISFVGGGLFGMFAGRALLAVVPAVRDDRLAEATFILALAYGAFIVAERLLHVSGVVAVLASGLTISALGRFSHCALQLVVLTDLWDQIAFWARSLIFILASILVPRLLGDIDPHDLLLLGVLIAASFAARGLVLFVLMPLLELVKLTQPISSAYKYAIIWGGLRGALTLVLALGVTENAALDKHAQRFVAVLATGFVLFHAVRQRHDVTSGHHRCSACTAFRRGTWSCATGSLQLLMRKLPIRCATWRDTTASLQGQSSRSSNRTKAGSPRRMPGAEAERVFRIGERLAIALVALGNQERVLVLETRADQVASQATVRCCWGMRMRWSKARVPKAVSDTKELRNGRSRFRQHSASPISFTGISELSGFLPIGWLTVSNCCW